MEKRGGFRKGSGRKKINGTDKVVRSFRVDNDEYELLKKTLIEYRENKKSGQA